MMYFHIVLYILIILYLYKFIFGKYRGYKGKETYLTGKITPLLNTHQQQIGKPIKFLQILLVLNQTLIVLIIVMGSAVYRNIFVPEGYKVLELNSQGWASIVDLFLLLGLISFLIYPIFSKKYLVRRFISKNKKGPYIDQAEITIVASDFNKIFKFGFYIFLLIYPVFILSLNQYSYYNDEQIVIRQVFKSEDTIIRYEDIKSINRYFKSGPMSDEISSMHYKIDYDDGEIDILFSTYTDQTLEIHRILKQMRPELFSDYTMTLQDTIFVESKRDAIKNQIYQIFS